MNTRHALVSLALLSVTVAACDREPSDRTRCKEGEHEACVEWMDYYMEQVDRREEFHRDDELLFISALDRACATKKLPEYCLIQGKSHSHGNYGLDLDKERSAESFVKACEFGSEEGCLRAHGMYMDDPPSGIGPAPKKARAVIEAACDQNDPLETAEVCAVFGEILGESLRPEDKETWQRLREQICVADSSRLSAATRVNYACLEFNAP